LRIGSFQLLEQLAWWDWPDVDRDRAMPLLLSGDVVSLARFAVRELGREVMLPTSA
jgi:hypothetical protein